MEKVEDFPGSYQQRVMSWSYWQVVFYPGAEKEYKKLGKVEQKQFIRKLNI